MNKVDVARRTKTFANRILRFVDHLPKNKTTVILGYQLLKSGASVNANYCKAERAESRADFVHRIAIVEKEIAQTECWLELLGEAGYGNKSERSALLKESCELLAIFMAMAIEEAEKAKNPKSLMRISHSKR